jgi:superoxide reductase
MTEKLEFYKCNKCSNYVQVFIEGEGELACCDEPMEHVVIHSKGEESLGEKHVPVITLNDNNEYEIRVTTTPHPMIPEHYVVFIQAISNDKMNVHTKFLCPGDEPMATLKCQCEDIVARELCNIHGLWEGKRDD